MPENNHSNAPLPPPHVQLIQMAMAHWVSRIAYVAAKLGLADHLASGPKTADDLAGRQSREVEEPADSRPFRRRQHAAEGALAVRERDADGTSRREC